MRQVRKQREQRLVTKREYETIFQKDAYGIHSFINHLGSIESRHVSLFLNVCVYADEMQRLVQLRIDRWLCVMPTKSTAFQATDKSAARPLKWRTRDTPVWQPKRQHIRRNNKTKEQRERRLAKITVCLKKRRDSETKEQREHRLARFAEYQKIRRDNETEEQPKRRHAKQVECKKIHRNNETGEQRKRRLAKHGEYKKTALAPSHWMH